LRTRRSRWGRPWWRRRWRFTPSHPSSPREECFSARCYTCQRSKSWRACIEFLGIKASMSTSRCVRRARRFHGTAYRLPPRTIGRPSANDYAHLDHAHSARRFPKHLTRLFHFYHCQYHRVRTIARTHKARIDSIALLILVFVSSYYRGYARATRTRLLTNKNHCYPRLLGA